MAVEYISKLFKTVVLPGNRWRAAPLSMPQRAAQALNPQAAQVHGCISAARGAPCFYYSSFRSSVAAATALPNKGAT